MNTVTVVGYGNMGSVLCQNLEKNTPLRIVETSESRRKLAHKEHPGAKIHAELDASSDGELIILAIKQKELPPLLPTLKAIHNLRLLSILAGVPLSFFAARLKSPSLARMMPSMAGRIGTASSGISFWKGEFTDDFYSQVRNIAEGIGSVYEVPEYLLSAITGLSGSGIAFALRFIDAMTKGGLREGLSLHESRKIAGEVVTAAAQLCKENPPHELISQISSPAGTTLEGTHVLDEGGFTSLVVNAVHASTVKAQKIEESFR